MREYGVLNRILFPQVRSITSEQEFKALSEKSEELEHRLFGERGFEKIVKKVEVLEKTLHIFYFLVIGYSFCTYSMSSDKASVILSAELWEHILHFIPGDNLYRALWSRCHNASQEFYNEIIYAYLHSHFVPDALVPTVIDKHFSFFKGSLQEEMNFRKKIVSAFANYNGIDTQKYREYSANVTNSEDPWGIPVPLSDERMKHILELLESRAKQRVLLAEQLQQTGEYICVIKDVKKLLSCLVCYRQFFASISTKLACVRALNKTRNWLNEHGIKLQALFLLCSALVLPMLAFVDKQENVITTAQLFIALLFFVTFAKYGTNYVCEEIIPSLYDHYIERIDNLEYVQQQVAILLRELE